MEQGYNAIGGAIFLALCALFVVIFGVFAIIPIIIMVILVVCSYTPPPPKKDERQEYIDRNFKQ